MSRLKKKPKAIPDNFWKNTTTIHELWFAVQDHMKQQYYELYPRIRYSKKRGVYKTSRLYKHLKWNKLYGYKALQRLSRFAQKNPKIVEVAVDDNVHAGSSLFLIPHEHKKEYWGTSVVFIPQCIDDLNVFFLYPDHLNRLIKELQKIQKRQERKGCKY